MGKSRDKALSTLRSLEDGGVNSDQQQENKGEGQ